MSTSSESAPFSERVQPLERFRDRLFRGSTWVLAAVVLILTASILLSISWSATPAIDNDGMSFLTSRVWDDTQNQYGILPEIWGTLYSSVLALLVGGVFGVAVAIFLSERMLSDFVFGLLRSLNLHKTAFFQPLPERLDDLLKNLIELLAAIPSVIYGLWGIFVVIPLLEPWFAWLHDNFGAFPLFGTEFRGRGMLPAALVLAIMILPTVSALSRDALVTVPRKLKEASYGLGATRWETLWQVVLPTASPGIFAAVILAFGRALGETMALVMLIGNNNQISLSLLSPGSTLASLLANRYGEATGYKASLLMYAALVLLAITLLINIVGNLIMQRARPALPGDRR